MKKINALLSEQKKEALVWQCEKGEHGMCMGTAFQHRGYGAIEPVYDAYRERYRQGMCPCQKEVLTIYLRREEQEAQRIKHDMLLKGSYAWLGPDWTDLDLEAKTFEGFNMLKQQDAYDAAQMWLDIMAGAFILHGPCGTGKTHLLAALCNALRKRGIASRFATTTKLFAAMQDLLRRDQSYMPLIKNAMTTPLLVLDDVEKAKRTDFREEIYFAIVDERVRKGLPIALSTNNLIGLEDFVGAAVYSRLKIKQIAIQMDGSDYREGME